MTICSPAKILVYVHSGLDLQPDWFSYHYLLAAQREKIEETEVYKTQLLAQTNIERQGRYM